MQKIFAKYICFVVTCALLAVLVYNYQMQSKNAQLHLAENSQIKLNQLAETLEDNAAELDKLKENLEEDYLARAHSFAYIIKQNPEILKSQAELNEIKGFLNVDELHVIDENGILIAGTIPKYFGMDFRTTEQTEEFLQILEDPRITLVQDVQPNGAEQKVFQYVGVSRMDARGIVQIGISPKRILEAQKKNELSYVFSRVPVDTGSSLFALDLDTDIILAHNDVGLVGKNAVEEAVPIKRLMKLDNGGFATFRGVRKFYTTRQYENILFGYAQQEDTMYADRNEQIFFIFAYTFLIFLIVILVINSLLKRQIVNGIHTIMGSLKSITEGKLDTVVKVESNPEFKQLSAGINQMVSSIVTATGRAAKIIDMVDMPIGVFEYGSDLDHVTVSSKLAHVLGWEKEKAKLLYRNKELFVEALRSIMLSGATEESEIYQIGKAPDKWVRIHMNTDENGTFGVVEDVTQDILEKRKIRHERDYDSLTGLCNHTTFSRQVRKALDGDALDTAAAMLMLDLDYFKGINDRYGHDWGDRYLKIAADFLRKLEGEKGIVGRRSGDEFCIFLYGYDSQEKIVEAVEGLYQRIADEPLTFPDGTVGKLQLSSGLAWYGPDLKDFESLLRAADEALYDSKNHGRGRNSLYRQDGL